MLLLGPLGFAAPWVLGALVVLPVLWVILRAMPPAPKRITFPGIALLAGLTDRNPVARRTPWWLLLLRLIGIAALIFAFAGTLWKPVVQDRATGPLLVVMDAGWPAAPDWSARQTRAERALADAAAAGRPTALIFADGHQMQAALSFQPADTLIARLRAARPMAWRSGLAGATDTVLADAPDGQLSTLWLADGTEYEGRAEWLGALAQRGDVTVIPPTRALRSLSLNQTETPGLTLRATDGADMQVAAIGPDPQGIQRELAQLTATDAKTVDGITERQVAIDLPPELRNRITSFRIIGESHAGAVVLADDRVRRRKVALVGDPVGQTEGQDLLSPLHYLRQALSPSADLVEGSLGDVLDSAPDVVILADQVQLPEIGELAEWVDQGGLLIRFGGPRMAGYDRLNEEPLLPVALRQGGRDIGGALSWGDPRGLKPFAEEGPFAGLTIPDDVAVRAQLMAQPAPDLAENTIAALTDNTPLMTRKRIGSGQVVLVHVTANAEWSNLPLSGLFVQMMDRLVASARVTPSDDAADDRQQPFWTPLSVLDGFGNPAATDGLSPVPADDLAKGPGPDRPAGIYTAGERQQALNAGGELTRATWPDATVMQAGVASGRDLKGLLLALAAIVLALDALGSAWLGRQGRAVAAVLLIMSLMPRPVAMAQDLDPDLIRAADEVALAYVITGDDDIDTISDQGLEGLSASLRQRTSVEPGRPIGIDLDVDDLSLLTFLYWPITSEQPAPSPKAYMRLNAFMRSGGVILFDTRDGDVAGVGGPDMTDTLQQLAAPLDIPQLAPVPEDHVLTRSFYLLQDFPGRWQGNPVWVEAPPVGVQAQDGVPFRQLNDGVSPVIIGGNSWAEAWAIDDDGYPVFPVGTGWEGEEQREMSFRFGINLVTYVLTGNYKSDQVHVPALLDRLRTEEALAQ